MANGTLQIYIAVAEQAAPLPGVTVSVFDESGARLGNLTTDSDGATQELSVPAPDASYSLDVNNNAVRPYAVYNLTAEKDGWHSSAMEGIQVFAGQQTVIRMNLMPAEEGILPLSEEEPIVIPPHTLFAGGGGSGPNPLGVCGDIAGQVLNEVIIPKKITVHLGKPSANVSNVSVNFIDYIANVASSEVYPTWVGGFACGFGQILPVPAQIPLLK